MQKNIALSIFVTIILSVGILLMSCSPAKPSVAEKKVKLGLLSFDTGAVADCGFPGSTAVVDLVRHINDTGGIPGSGGVMIDLVRIDTGYEIPRALSAYDKMVKQDKVLGIASWGSATNDALREKAINDGVAMCTWGCGHDLVWPATVWFSAGPAFGDLGRGMMQWLKEYDWPKKGKTGKPKVAVVMSDNALGWSLAVGPLTGAEMFDFEMLPLQFEPLNLMDASGTALKLKGLKPDYIFMFYTQHGQSIISRDLKRAGVIPGAQLIGFLGGLDATCIERSEGAITGIYGATPFNMFSADLPGIQEIKNFTLGYDPSLNPDVPVVAQGCFFAGIDSMGLLENGVEAAIKKVGYDKLDRQAVVAGIESLQNVNMWDTMTVTGSTGDHRCSQQMRVVQLQADGNIVNVSDWFNVPSVPDWEKRGEKLPSTYIP